MTAFRGIVPLDDIPTGVLALDSKGRPSAGTSLPDGHGPIGGGPVPFLQRPQAVQDWHAMRQAEDTAPAFDIPEWLSTVPGGPQAPVPEFVRQGIRGFADSWANLGGSMFQGIVDLNDVMTRKAGFGVNINRAIEPGAVPVDRAHVAELRRQGREAEAARLEAVGAAVSHGSDVGVRAGTRSMRLPSSDADPSSWGYVAGGTAGSAVPLAFAAIPGVGQGLMASSFIAQGYENGLDRANDLQMAATGTIDESKSEAIAVSLGVASGLAAFVPVRMAKSAIDDAVSIALKGAPGWEIRYATRLMGGSMAAGAKGGALQGASMAMAQQVADLVADPRERDLFWESPVGWLSVAAVKAMGGALHGGLAGALGGAIMGAAAGGRGAQVRAAQSAIDAGALEAYDATPVANAGDAVAHRPMDGGETPVASAIPERAPAAKPGKPAIELNADVEGVADTRAVVLAAFGLDYAETKGAPPPGRHARIPRAEAIRSLKKAGLLPDTFDPMDLAYGIVEDPVRHGLVGEAIASLKELKRSQAEALFGTNAKEQMPSASDRDAWLTMFKEEWASKKPERPTGPEEIAALTRKEGKPEPAPTGTGFEQGLGSTMRTMVFDKFDKQDKYQARIEEETGQPVPPDANVTHRLRTQGSVTAHRIALARERHVIPFIAHMRKHGLNLREIMRLAIAQHAEEANSVIARRTPDETVGLGITNREAAEVIAEAKARPDAQALFEAADMVRAMVRDAVEVQRRSGNITEAEYLRLDAVYKDLVQVRDDPTQRQEAAMAGRNPTLTARGDTRHRLGRRQGSLLDGSERSEAILAMGIPMMIANLDTSIRGAASNDIGNTIRRLMEFHPDDLAYRILAEPPEVRALGPEGEATMREELTRRYLDKENVLSFRMDEDAAVDKTTLRKGERFYVEVGGAGDRLLASALKATGRHEPGINAALALLRVGSAITRFMATNGLNLTFHLRNKAKDVGAAVSAIAAEHGMDGQVYGDFLRMQGPAYASLLAAEARGRLPQGADEVATMHREFVENGGKMAAWAPMEAPKLKDYIESQLAPLTNVRATAKRGFAAFERLSDAIAAPVENSTRLAYYIALRRKGVTVEKAILKSRDLTLDFARHGTHTEPLRAAYAFFGAGLTGVHKLARVLSSKRGMAVAAAWVAMGMANREMQRRIQGGDANDDGIPDFQEVRGHVASSHAIIPVGTRGFVKVPLPWGFGAFFEAGRVMSDVMHGEGTLADHFGRIGNAALDAVMPIGGANMFSSGEAFGHSIVPDTAKPLVDLGFNSDWRGQSIWNEPYAKDDPYWKKWEHARPSTWPLNVRISRTLSQWTGETPDTRALVGSKVVDVPGKPGLVNVAPEAIGYVMEQFTGGTGKLVRDSIGAILEGLGGGDRHLGEYPIVGVFYGETPDRAEVASIVREEMLDAKPAGAPGHKEAMEADRDLDKLRKRLAAAKVAGDLKAVQDISRRIEDREASYLRRSGAGRRRGPAAP